MARAQGVCYLAQRGEAHNVQEAKINAVLFPGMLDAAWM